MAEAILHALGVFIIGVINTIGYAGVFVLMAIESANIPLPSEITMPFAGFLASEGRFNIWALGVVGALGNLAGSLVIYWLLAWKGMAFVDRYGKYFFMRKEDVELADKWFLRHGGKIIFWGRLLPVVRTFISTPAGLFKMPLWRFTYLTFFGSFLWSLFLTWIGFELGERWEDIHIYFSKFSNTILAILVVGAVGWVWHHFYYRKKKKNL